MFVLSVHAAFCKQITSETFFLCEKERRILFSAAVEFWDQNKTINTTRFVIWPQEQIYFQSAKPIFFASWILVVSPELWNWNLYPNIYYSASEFLLSNDQNNRRLNRRIPRAQGRFGFRQSGLGFCWVFTLSFITNWGSGLCWKVEFGFRSVKNSRVWVFAGSGPDPLHH